MMAEVPKRVAPLVKFLQKAYCPECGKHVSHGEVEKMRDACTRMWRKFMQLDDAHCPLFRVCDVTWTGGKDSKDSKDSKDYPPGLWERMPRIKETTPRLRLRERCFALCPRCRHFDWVMLCYAGPRRAYCFEACREHAGRGVA
ncbi:unnamed protein product [Symbiodinium natans]|uniref:Uncharacterized protein n=1 Tax=Symbiodinium natans TaxID=878477 RepID=A0A812PKH4_9DINO|nr:unnamed protein product [Symbiodinium natans]